MMGFGKAAGGVDYLRGGLPGRNPNKSVSI